MEEPDSWVSFLAVETSFGGNEMQLARVADYLNAISPCVEKQPTPMFSKVKLDTYTISAGPALVERLGG